MLLSRADMTIQKMGMTTIEQIDSVSIMTSKIKVFLALLSLARGQVVKIGQNDTILSQMDEPFNITCYASSYVSNNVSIESCNWIRTDEYAYQDPFYLEYPQYMPKDEYRCEPGLDLENEMKCLGDFKAGLCILQVDMARGIWHEGNWTCQLKVNSDWINATNFVLVQDVTPPDDLISKYLQKLVNGVLESVQTLASLMEEFDNMK